MGFNSGFKGLKDGKKPHRESEIWDYTLEFMRFVLYWDITPWYLVDTLKVLKEFSDYILKIFLSRNALKLKKKKQLQSFITPINAQ